MRALVVTNLWPTPAAPQRGIFVRDQIEALRALGGVEIDVHHVPPGGVRPYLRAARDLRRRARVARPDVIHAHFGLTAGRPSPCAAPRTSSPSTARTCATRGRDA